MSSRPGACYSSAWLVSRNTRSSFGVLSVISEAFPLESCRATTFRFGNPPEAHQRASGNSEDQHAPKSLGSRIPSEMPNVPKAPARAETPERLHTPNGFGHPRRPPSHSDLRRSLSSDPERRGRLFHWLGRPSPYPPRWKWPDVPPGVGPTPTYYPSGYPLPVPGSPLRFYTLPCHSLSVIGSTSPKISQTDPRSRHGHSSEHCRHAARRPRGMRSACLIF